MIKVKPLLWRTSKEYVHEGKFARDHHSANYIIHSREDSVKWKHNHYYELHECDTLEEAKQACFEHWSNIVLLAIEEE